MDTATRKSSFPLEQFYGVLFVIGATLAFSSKAIWIKLIYRQAAHVDAISIMTLRMAFALPVYLFIVLLLVLRQPRRPSIGSLATILSLSFLGYYLASFLDITGLAYIPAGLERMILFLYPTMVVLMMARQGRRPISREEGISLATSYIGIALVFFDELSMGSANVILGSMLVFGAALSFSVFTVKSASHIRRMGSMRFTASTMLASSMMTLIHFSATHGLKMPQFSQQVYLLAAVLAIAGTIVPSFLMAEGIRRIGPDRTVLFAAVGPVSTIVLGLLVLSEPVSLLQVTGAAVITAGVLHLSRQRSRE